ncbi:unnamed protein product, partial [Linum tenue]
EIITHLRPCPPTPQCLFLFLRIPNSLPLPPSTFSGIHVAAVNYSNASHETPTRDLDVENTAAIEPPHPSLSSPAIPSSSNPALESSPSPPLSFPHRQSSFPPPQPIVGLFL